MKNIMKYKKNNINKSKIYDNRIKKRKVVAVKKISPALAFFCGTVSVVSYDIMSNKIGFFEMLLGIINVLCFFIKFTELYHDKDFLNNNIELQKYKHLKNILKQYMKNDYLKEYELSEGIRLVKNIHKKNKIL